MYFHFVFGDGDPNPNFEEQEWQTIAHVIEANQGVITAEMLAPYAGEDPKEEDWMVHVLQRFNGMPEVTESGGIVYLFPAFQNQAGAAISFDPEQSLTPQANLSGADLNNLYRSHLSRQNANHKGEVKRQHLDRALTQKTWPFMSVAGGTLTAIIAFASTLILGSVYVLANTSLLAIGLHDILIPHPEVMNIIVGLSYATLVYGLLFLFIPALRFVIYRMINDKIEMSNNAKLEYAAQVANPGPELAKKLDDAKVIRISGLPKGPDKIAYTTEKDAAEQETDDDYRLPPS